MSRIIFQEHVVPSHTPQLNDKFKSHFSEQSEKLQTEWVILQICPLLHTPVLSGREQSLKYQPKHVYKTKLKVLKKTKSSPVKSCLWEKKQKESISVFLHIWRDTVNRTTRPNQIWPEVVSLTWQSPSIHWHCCRFWRRARPAQWRGHGGRAPGHRPLYPRWTGPFGRVCLDTGCAKIRFTLFTVITAK